MQFYDQTTGIKMYGFALDADFIWDIYHGNTVLLDVEKGACHATRAGEIYLIINANLYGPDNYKLDSLSARLLSLLSGVNRKLFDRIWPPKKELAHRDEV